MPLKKNAGQRRGGPLARVAALRAAPLVLRERAEGDREHAPRRRRGLFKLQRYIMRPSSVKM